MYVTISSPISASPVLVVIPLNVANDDVSAIETTVSVAVNCLCGLCYFCIWFYIFNNNLLLTPE